MSLNTEWGARNAADSQKAETPLRRRPVEETPKTEEESYGNEALMGFPNSSPRDLSEKGPCLSLNLYNPSSCSNQKRPAKSAFKRFHHPTRGCSNHFRREQIGNDHHALSTCCQNDGQIVPADAADAEGGDA